MATTLVNNDTVAQDAIDRVARIDSVIQRHIDENHIPGAVALVYKDGKPVYDKAFGYSDIDEGKEMSRDAIFRIASQSKAITTLGALILWEEGKFLLDDPVSKYIPAFSELEVLDGYNVQDGTYTTTKARREILIRDLLRHTSGIAYPAVFSDPTMWKIYEEAGIPSGIGSSSSTLENEILKLAEMPLMHQPGEAFTYGLNIDLLGYLIQVWSGKRLDVFLRERVFEPLEMNDTWFYLPEEKHNRLVELYESVGEDSLKVVDHLMYEGVEKDFPKHEGTYFSGGAGLSSTAQDLVKFFTVYLNEGLFKGKRILSSSTVKMALKNQLRPGVEASPLPPQPKDFQFSLAGFAVETDKNDYLSPRTLGSFGWGGAFNTHGWADKESNMICILLTQEYLSSYYSIGAEFEVAVYQAIDEF